MAVPTGTLTLSLLPQTWTPPIGIPAPDFGGSIGNPILTATPARPGDWSAPIAGYYYVNPGDGASTDVTQGGELVDANSRRYGSATIPRKTLPCNATVAIPAGSYVEVHGTYATDHSNAHVNAAGNNSAWVAATSGPVWITSQDNTTNRATATAKWTCEGSYGFIQRIYFDGRGTTSGGKISFSTVDTSSYWCIRENEARGDPAIAGMFSAGVTAPNSVSNVVFYNNVHNESGDLDALPEDDQDSQFYGVGANASYIWIVDNTGAWASGTGCQVNAGSLANESTTHHIYVGRNTFSYTRQAGVWAKQSTDVIFSQNTCHHVRPRGTASRGKGGGCQYGPVRCWFLFNTFHSEEIGIGQFSVSGLGSGGTVHLLGNLIYNCHSESGSYAPENSYDVAGVAAWGDIYIASNTIMDCDGTINLADNITAPVVILNNILDTPAYAGAHTIQTDSNARASHITCDYNLFLTPTVIRWGSSTQYDSLLAFQNGTTQGDHCQEAASANLDANYRLTAGSTAAIDLGTQAAAYDLFFTLYGIDIEKDIDGVARTGAWDIGCDER